MPFHEVYVLIVSQHIFLRAHFICRFASCILYAWSCAHIGIGIATSLTGRGASFVLCSMPEQCAHQKPIALHQTRTVILSQQQTQRATNDLSLYWLIGAQLAKSLFAHIQTILCVSALSLLSEINEILVSPRVAHCVAL